MIRAVPRLAPALCALSIAVAASLCALVAEAQPEPRQAEPFAFGDFSWVPGNYGASVRPLSTGHFTGELRIDTAYHYSFATPTDNTIGGSSEVFRHNELQVTQLGIGGDFFYKNVHARLMTQFGMYSQTTPRNDASPARGQWQLDDAYRYISEAYGGYHIDAHARHQHPGRHLHVVRRPVELLQLRQLDVSAVVRLVEHAVVLQRRARPDLPDRQAEDRALARQRLAVVRQVQPGARRRRADHVEADRVASRCSATSTTAPTRSGTATASASTPTTA